eukprot:3788341-Pyramimonas_sp.AAC.1
MGLAGPGGLLGTSWGPPWACWGPVGTSRGPFRPAKGFPSPSDTGRSLWPEACQTIGPYVPRIGSESLRGTRGGGRGGEETEEEGEWRRRYLECLLGYSGFILGHLCGFGCIFGHY